VGAPLVNDAVRVAVDGLLTTADLAARPDFALGLAVVSPSSRTVAGPGGTADVEPRVMQVLVVLADHAGQVVTREALFRRCWGGVYVGDDSLNRAIAAVRRLASEIGGGSFEIETIPRTGYRLEGAAAPLAVESAAVSPEQRISRRSLIAGSAAAVAGAAALVAGGLSWNRRQDPDDPQFAALMKRAEASLRSGPTVENTKTLQILRRAVSARPDSAKGWGTLALFQSIVAPASANAEELVEDAKRAASKALAMDPKESNALLAMFELEGPGLDWFTRDKRLRHILAVDPENVMAISELVALLQSAGLNRESWNWNERAIRIEPVVPDLLCRRAMKLWIFRRYSDADKVIDQARALWPSLQFVWWVRFLLLATTGRAFAAKAMLDSDPTALPPPSKAMWRPSLAALDDPTPGNITRAREACIAAGRLAGSLAAHGVMILGALNQVDAAFEIADGFLLWRGRVVRTGENRAKELGTDPEWRMGIQWLFTPPCASMRRDGRFAQLCDARGLTDYWKRRGVRPDYLLADR
jgi:DNA-binding winged helix-turn-helix (wHTH) protein